MRVKIAAWIDQGVVRKHQEDRFIICTNLEEAMWKFERDIPYDNEHGDFLFVVSDGMGGANAGNVASELAVTKIQEFSNERGGQYSDALSFLEEAIVFINKSILDYGELHPESSGMGATILLGLLSSEKLHCAWIGDSRIYRLAEGRLERISKDHSYVQTLVDKGEITEEEAFTHPRKNVITQSLGMTQDLLQPEMKAVQLTEGERIIFCTDGLNGMLRDGEIEEILGAYSALDEALVKLVETANFKGGLDNITVVGFEMGQFQISENVSNSSLDTIIKNDELAVPTTTKHGATRGKLISGTLVAFALVMAFGIYFWEKTRDKNIQIQNTNEPMSVGDTTQTILPSKDSSYVDSTITEMFRMVPKIEKKEGSAKKEINSDEKALSAQLEKNQKFSERIKAAVISVPSSQNIKKDSMPIKANVNPKGYIVQTGAFTNGANVKVEVKKLQELKLDKKIEIIEEKGFSKVMITKFATEEEARIFIKKYLNDIVTVIKPL